MRSERHKIAWSAQPRHGSPLQTNRRNPGRLWSMLVIGLAMGVFCPLTPEALSAEPGTQTDSPRIVNIYNFIRNSDFRLENSQEILFDCTRRQMELLKRADLPATWALQYDALINPKYQRLLKEQLRSGDEIAAWWEIPRPLAETAGLEWHGAHDWDPVANVGFSPGYTPAERRKLVDVYMTEFKSVFGFHPRSVGSWFIDEVTLAYMVERYGIVASCNCKDQIGTDFYTLWGGYWNQAYYPSRVNAYMPAQTRAGQIDVPVFRMLGSDPIYQHGTTPGLQSLEPVYPETGGSSRWVAWFMNSFVHQPPLAFAYTQAGQENSFGWKAMEQGLTNQIALFAARSKAGSIRVETLEQSGRWFKNRYPLTPATAVVTLDDWKDQGRKTVWYNSRFYRLNVLWEDNAFFIRDIHCFDERIVSPTYQTPLKESSLSYETLPIVDWAFWSQSGRKTAGLWPGLLLPDGSTTPLRPEGLPIVKEVTATQLSMRQPCAGGGTWSVLCSEKDVTLEGLDKDGKPLPWALTLLGGPPMKSVVKRVSPGAIDFHYLGVNYRLSFGKTGGSCRQLEGGSIQISPDGAGRIILQLDSASIAASATGVPHRTSEPKQS